MNILEECYITMNNPISDKIKSEIMSLWCLGLPRDTIANSLKISGGTVSNYIAKWKNEIGAPNAEAVRDFCVLAKSQNVSPLQCAEGFRILNMLRNCGISEDQFTGFIVKFNDQCKSSTEEPKRIYSVCRQILELDEPVPLAQLPEFISKLSETRKALETGNAILEQGMKELKQAYSKLFEKRNVTQFDLDRYKKTERELIEYGLSFQDLEKLAKVLENVDRIGGEPNEIVKALAEIKDYRNLEEKVTVLRSTIERFEKDLKVVEHKLASRKLSLDKCKEVEEIQISLEDLRTLKNIVLESAAANSLDPENAFRRVADDVLTNYDVTLGLDKKITEMNQELSEIRMSHGLIKLECSKFQNVHDTVIEFLSHNQQADDIVEIGEIVKASGEGYSDIKEDLKLYGNLRKANSLLSARNEKLESENRELTVENSVLKSEKERRSGDIRSLIERQKGIEQGFERWVYQRAIEYHNRFKKMKNAYVIAKAKSTQNIKAMEASERHQMSQLHKINVPFELSPIIDAARGYTVNGEGLKRATIRAMELMILRLDDNDNSQAKLKMKQALQSLTEEFIVF
jgi:exonuclease VII small subunit